MTGAEARRAHTGRQRNEAARKAILDATLRLVRHSGDAVSVDAIAAEAGVGKQTIYRWWPTKYAVLLDTMLEQARLDVPTPDTGTLRGDLDAFLGATFRGARNAATAALLRTIMAQAQRDAAARDTLRDFTKLRREALGQLLERGRDRGELAADADVELMVEQVYGLLWYRLMIGHGSFDRSLAARLTAALLAQGSS